MAEATEADVIRWQLKCLADVASELSEGELTLVISFGDQFARKGTLSERQKEVLYEIYKKRT
jgi:hypothetical protein